MNYKEFEETVREVGTDGEKVGLGKAKLYILELMKSVLENKDSVISKDERYITLAVLKHLLDKFEAMDDGL